MHQQCLREERTDQNKISIITNEQNIFLFIYISDFFHTKFRSSTIKYIFYLTMKSQEANIRSRRIENGWDGSDGWSSWNDWNGGNGWNGWNGWNAGNGWNVGNVENGWNVGNGWNMLDCGIIKGLVNIDMKTLFSQPLPRWRIEKCFAACVGEVVGIVS